MSLKSDFLTKHGISENDVFEIILGDANNVLPGGTWQSYFALMGEDTITCYKANDESTVIELSYSSFTKAEFGLGSGNLWLQCNVGEDFLAFCSTKKNWLNAAGQKLVGKLDSFLSEEDKKLFAKATGKFSAFYVFFKSML
ncbi:MAG: hypothetical protein IJ021_06580 [Clostridia bacterium]|nr:hypothetical protein [Clostridia bacterium]MBQ9746782.1 hypothetical protein [Clostridia bacterium]